MFKTTPPAPLILTLSGILPFIGLALAMVWAGEDIALRSTMALWLLIYAAVISSFVAGVRWGAEISIAETPSTSTLVVSVLPPLLAWVAVGLYFRFASALVFLAMAVLFAALYAWDRGSADLPKWYRGLRIWPSLGAAFSLLVAYGLLR